MAEYDEAYKQREENLRHLQKEAFQLANYYFVFQGVIFTAFYSAPSALKCRYRWVPFALSLLAGVLNLYVITTLACKYTSLLHEKDTSTVRAFRDRDTTSASMAGGGQQTSGGGGGAQASGAGEQTQGGGAQEPGGGQQTSDAQEPGGGQQTSGGGGGAQAPGGGQQTPGGGSQSRGGGQQTSGGGGGAQTSDGGQQNNSDPISTKTAHCMRKVNVWICLVLFAAFFAITLAGTWLITCGDRQVAAEPPSHM